MPILSRGAGCAIVLRSLPSLVIPPIVALTLPTLLARAVSDLPLARLFLELPSPLRWCLSLIFHALVNSAVRRYARRQDRKRLGPDVVEVPVMKMRWPGNVDFIPYMLHSMKTNYCMDSWVSILKQYGNTVNVRLLGQDTIITTEPENIKAILCTDFASFEKGQAFRDKMFSVLGTGVFNSDGDMWKFHRSMTRPYFTRDRISHFDLFAHHSDAALSHIFAQLSAPGSPAIDFQDLVGRFTLDASTAFLFGQHTRALDASHPADDGATSFAAAFGRAQDALSIRFGLSVLWAWAELGSDRTAADGAVIDAFVRPILREKLEEKKRRGKATETGDGGDTLLDHLVNFTDDENVIKDEVINILVAGRDTTAATLTFAGYLLATHPHVMEKLRNEILTHVGPTNYPTSDDFRDMKYLRAVINETLRLFPPVPVNERTAVKSTVFKSGGKSFYVPKDTTVRYSVLHMHRRKDLWGPDADEFDPERWIDERLKKYLTPNPFIFLPFNAGPRICLGQQFAYNESSFFLVRLLQRVESISLAPDAHRVGTLPPKEWENGTGRTRYEKVWPKSHLTIYCSGGMWVRMKEASTVE